MDKSVCTFYQKIGACRHGEKCSRKHIRPSESKTILLSNLYSNPKASSDGHEKIADKQAAVAFDHFYSDVFKKLCEFGEVDRIVVCENENFHLSGNVYVRFTTTQAAHNAVMSLNQEWYAGRPVYCELSPVTSFHEANCRAYDTNSCNRGDHCNFMHVVRPSEPVSVQLRQAQDKKIALQKIRAAMNDPDWGKQWEEATNAKYKREAGPSKDKPREPEKGLPVQQESVGDAKESKIDVVAKLFGKN